MLRGSTKQGKITVNSEYVHSNEKKFKNQKGEI